MTRPDYDYDSIEEIQSNGTTGVYRAHDQRTGRPCVLKILHTDYPTAHDVSRLRREYDIINSLSLDGVVRPYGLKHSAHGLALVLEDFGGVPLSQVLASDPDQFTLEHRLQIAIQLAHTLGEIHRHGVIHRDIKPANILVNPTTGQVKIADFGIAVLAETPPDPLDQANQFEGSLAYIAPEQTGRMNRATDYRADLYSLGVTLYEMLTRQLPFDSADPLELVHAHIARQPPALTELNPDVPAPLAAVVLKLLAKTPESRYQSAAGLKADLEFCLEHWQYSRDIPNFPLGQHDSGPFQLPDGLYGRADEQAALLSTLERVSQGERACVFIAGAGGTGKTTLVRELEQPVRLAGGYLLTGRCEATRRVMPYYALIQAVQELVHRLLTENETCIAYWKETILAALTPNAQVIIDVIPEVELVVGAQPPVPELPPAETQNRLHLAFKRFFQIFSQQEAPLVICLDNVQWVDAATLSLMQVLLTDPATTRLLLLGAFNDHDGGAQQSLTTMLDTLYAQGVAAQHIELHPLDRAAVNRLLADALQSSSSATELLTDFLYQKTGGNPLFVRQLVQELYQAGYFVFDPASGQWRWDAAQLEHTAITDNVAAFLVEKIQKLPSRTQELVQAVACIGNPCRIDLLTAVTDESTHAIASALLPATHAGVLLMSPGEDDATAPHVSFLHDHLQQAVYMQMDDDQKQALHLRVGRLLRQQADDVENEGILFDVVHHLYAGRVLIQQSAERDELVLLLLRAGRKARDAAAFDSARRCFVSGLELLPPDSWQQRYDLTLALHTEAMEMAFLSMNLDQVEHYSALIMQHAQTLLDKVRVYETQIRWQAAQNQMHQAVETGLQALDMLGVTLRDDQPHLRLPHLHTAEGIAALADLPAMTDPAHLAALRIFALIRPPAYQVRPDVVPQLAATMVNLSITSGNTQPSSMAYSLYGIVLCARGDIDTGYRFCQVALDVMTRCNPAAVPSKRIGLFEFVRHWKEHARASREPFRLGVQSSLDLGDIERAGYNALNYCRYLLLTGEPLDAVAREQATYCELLRTYQQEAALVNLRVEHQLTLNLMQAPDAAASTQESPPWRLVGTSVDEDTLLPTLHAARLHGMLFYFYYAKLYLCYMFGEISQAVEYARTAATYARSAGAMISSMLHTFYASLTFLAAETDLDIVETNLERMQRGATHAPMNYQHKYELVAAEQARLQGRVVEAMERYDRAIEGAREHGYTHEAALANELAGMFYLVLGREKIARLYLSEARTCYAHWGAWAKVAQLENRYPSLVGNSSAASKRSNGQGRGTRTTSSTGGERLDVSTVIKAAQALSSEIELDTLLDKVVRIVIENAGAQRGVLVLERDGSLIIAAEEAVEQDAPHATLPRTLDDDAGETLPSAVINYAWHTDESLVLSNPINDQRFTNDPYISRCQPQSILCIPIQSRGSRAGIIYLENNLAADAFSRDRIEMARTLVAHAAISLENARLYESMKQEAQERTRAEEALRSITEATATVTGGDFFRSLVCYLASTLEVRYALVAECTDASHTRVRTLALLGDGQFGDDIEYDVAGTPCDSVVAGNVSYYPERLSELFPHSGGMESYLGAPLHDSSGGILGHLAVMHDQPMHRTPYDISLLQIFAARAGVELERKRADEALKRREEELRRLNERLEDYNRNLEQKVLERTHEIERRRRVAEGLHDLLTILNSSRALDEILDYIVAQAIALLDAQSSAIYRLQQDKSILSIQASRGLPLEYVNDLTFPIHSSFMGRAMVRRAPVVISDPGGDHWMDEIEISEARRQILSGYQTLLAVPLVRQGDIEEGDEIYGGIALYYHAAHEFSEEEIGLAVAFADQAALAIQNAQLRQRVKQAAVMEERSRLARDLHDSVTQSLYSLTLLAEGWRRLAGSGRLEDMTEPLTELGGIAQQALKEMRLLVHELRPPTLEREGLLGALHERLASVERRAGVEARLLADDVVEMPPLVEEELYRIAQEALNNALKHAEATTVTVHLRSSEGLLALEVIDNGVGFDPEEVASRGGIGLSSMRERAEKFGGVLHIRSRPQEGTCVKIELRAN